MNKIGITERGDAGIDFKWVKKLEKVDFAILITKSVNDKFIEEILKVKDKAILHATITGYGGTMLEPNVKDIDWSVNQLNKLIELGFPKEQIVLRLDPIIPTDKGLFTMEEVLKAIKPLGIKRCRISFLDMYKHVKERFNENDIRIPYYSFNPPQYMIDNFHKKIEPWKDIYEFEACAELIECRIGCVSQKDANILNKTIDFQGNINQRGNCLCPLNKYELLSNKKQCPHGCLYCYWKINN